MCLSCGKHNTENIWYLSKEKHRIKSLGLFKDIVSKNLNPLISVGLKMVKLKQPDYVDCKMNLVTRSLLDWFAKTLHGMQFLPDLDSAFNIVDMSNELALTPCLCRLAMDPDDPPVYRCIAMNIAADIYYQNNGDVDVKPISKGGAKELISTWRQKGSWQSVGWLWDANVIWICNCDDHCVSYRAPEVTWGGIPSFLVTTVGKSSACSGCRECANWCKHGALTHGDDGKVVINSTTCKGCGLCVENCPNQVLIFKPRKTYYDISTKTIKHLGNQMIDLD